MRSEIWIVIRRSYDEYDKLFSCVPLIAFSTLKAAQDELKHLEIHYPFNSSREGEYDIEQCDFRDIEQVEN